jgi:hypothetical protein
LGKRKPNRRLLLIIAIAAVGFGYWWHHEPDAFFQSSDANWADSELLWKGRDFRTVVIRFELYRIQCDAPDASLIRTSIRNPVNVFAWYNYLTDSKWLVPYGQRDDSIETYYPAVHSEHCANKAVSEEDYIAARERASNYVSALGKDKPPLEN